MKQATSRAQRQVIRAGKRIDWRVDLDVRRAAKGLEGKHFFPGVPGHKILKEGKEAMREQKLGLEKVVDFDEV